MRSRLIFSRITTEKQRHLSFSVNDVRKLGTVVVGPCYCYRCTLGCPNLIF